MGRIIVFLLCLLISSRPLSATNLKKTGVAQLLQNEEADRENLVRIQDDDQLEEFKQDDVLIELPVGKTIRVDDRLDPKYQWCLPQVWTWLTNQGRDYFAKFHQPLQINSAVRTMDYQEELRKTNGNAAVTDGPFRSSHPTGATIDIAKREMSSAERKWMRDRLDKLMKNGKIVAIEERKQPCFHVMVFNDADPEMVEQVNQLAEVPLGQFARAKFTRIKRVVHHHRFYRKRPS